jgi:CubicO group peptidase (beta-lactamase class C family)
LNGVNLKKLFFFIIITILSCGNLPGQKKNLLDQKLNEIKKQFDAVGMSVVVVKDNKVIYSKGFGVSDVLKQTPADENTIFRIASISKTITGTAIMQLYEKGKLKITEDISRYLGYKVRNPKYPDDSITCIQLMTHTSSLLDGTGYDGYLTAVYSDTIPKIKEILLQEGKFFTTDMWANYKPGIDSFTYCNLAFGILGSIVEKISGERFDEYCRKHILIPLGMNSSFNVLDIDLNKLAVLYRKQDSVWVAQYDDYKVIKPKVRNLTNYKLGDNGSIFSPQGGLRTSALDLSKFMRMHMNGGIFNGTRILNDTTVALMHKIYWSGSGLSGFYKKKGLTIQTTEDLIPGETLLGHSGEAYGLLSDMYFSKDNKFGIVLMTNGCNSTSGEGVFQGIEEAVNQSVYETLIKNPSSIDKK